jgi:serine/threonine protein kinase
VRWEVTPGKAVVKISPWARLRSVPHAESPVNEAAAVQHVARGSGGAGHPHVIAALDVLQDEDFLLLFLPYCSSGDMLGLVQQAGRLPEHVARYFFRQILEVRAREVSVQRESYQNAFSPSDSHFFYKGLSHLHRLGICHRGK